MNQFDTFVTVYMYGINFLQQATLHAYGENKLVGAVHGPLLSVHLVSKILHPPHVVPPLCRDLVVSSHCLPGWTSLHPPCSRMDRAQSCTHTPHCHVLGVSSKCCDKSLLQPHSSQPLRGASNPAYPACHTPCTGSGG